MALSVSNFTYWKITMSRKDFNLIADTISVTPIADRDRVIIARYLASALRATNDRFDKERFIAACTN
jgi:hypothetical protein